jgi:hypothetical protein
MEMLFLLAYWQGLAKLRLHTEDTLTILDDVTRSLGIALHAFKTSTCTAFETRELPAEAAARSRKEARAAFKKQWAAESSRNREEQLRGKGKEKEKEAHAISRTGKGVILLQHSIY